MSKAYRRKACRLCNGTDFQLVLKLADTPLADSYIQKKWLGVEQELYPIELYRCNACGHTQMGLVIDIEEVYLDYIYETISSPGLVEHFQKYADQCFSKFGIAKGDFTVDIGSNDGTLMKFFQDKGLRILGIDPAKETARQATEAGLQTLPEFFSVDLAKMIRKKYGSAKLVTSNNLVADVDDVQELVKGVRELLTTDGIFRFESFYFPDQIRNLVFDFTYHEHFSYFTMKSLQKFFDSMDMELIDAERVETKGGSVRFTVQLKGAGRPVAPSIKAFCDEEDAFGMENMETYKNYEKRIAEAKKETTSCLKELKANGKSIVGFGASATSTTLIYHFGLGEYLEYLVDDYKAKQGLYSPGLHIPVHPGSKIYETKPDYVLVLAWRYYKPIIKNYNQYFEDGGTFIIPLPELQLLKK